MNRVWVIVLAGVLHFLSADSCCATPIVSFDSNPPAGAGGVVHLSVGDTLIVDVLLSHLDPGEQLDELGVDVAWNGSLLGSPTTPTPGSIVPDVTGFSSGSSPGHASGVYDDLFATGTGGPISSTGTFFSFSVTAAAPGSGTITFSPPPTAFDAGGGENDPTPGPDLSYDIAPAGSAVPEPSSLVLAGLAVACGGIWHSLCRRRPQDAGSRMRLKRGCGTARPTGSC